MWFIICLSVNVIYLINRLKEKNYHFDIIKSFDKIQHPCMIKALFFFLGKGVQLNLFVCGGTGY